MTSFVEPLSVDDIHVFSEVFGYNPGAIGFGEFDAANMSFPHDEDQAHSNPRSNQDYESRQKQAQQPSFRPIEEDPRAGMLLEINPNWGNDSFYTPADLLCTSNMNVSDFAVFDVKDEAHLNMNPNAWSHRIPEDKPYEHIYYPPISHSAPRRRVDEAAQQRKEVSEKFLTLVNNSEDKETITKQTAEDDGKTIHTCSAEGCNRQFTWLWALREHEHKHTQGTKSREHKCDFCGKAFFTKSCLKSHVKIHTRKPNSYKCKHVGCTKTYSTSEGLRLHIRNHHQVDKRWSCPVDDCVKKFVRQSDLRLHIMRIHAKTRPHPCRYDGCSKSFACFSELRRHEQSHLRKMKKNENIQKKRQK